MEGQQLSHYTIVSKIGEGGMGAVYRAIDSRLNRTVAIKILPPHAGTDPDRRRRFVQEAQSASALNHPNIVHIYDIDTAGDVTFIAMEFVDGRPLDAVIGDSPVPMALALEYDVVYETGHAVVFVQPMIKEVLDWLDRYLGPVRQAKP